MKNKIISIIPYIIFLISIVLSILLYNTIKNRNKLEKVNHQNVLALNGKLEIYKRDSVVAYKRIASIENLNEKLKTENKELFTLLENNKEIIMSQAKYIIKLEAIIDSGKEATSTGHDIPNNILGKEIIFSNKDKNPFYDYEIKVTLGNPSTHKLSMFFKDINMTSHITRNKDGVWAGYIETSSEISKYLKIKQLSVVLDSDNYLSVESNLNKFHLDLMLGGGVFVFPQAYLHLGVGLVMNNTHCLYYSHGIGTSFNYLTYAYKLSLIK
jgi:hypothetical protein